MKPTIFKDLIQKFEYGQYNILNQELEIVPDRLRNRVHINPFYRHHLNEVQGTCSELTNTTYREIKKYYPHLHVTRAVGNDPHFFNSIRETHCFLLVSEHDLLEGKKKGSGLEAKAQVQNPLIVDPSFNTVQPLSESDYVIKNLFNEGYQLKFNNYATIPNKAYVPIGIDSRDNLIAVRARIDAELLFEVVIKEPGKTPINYSIDSPLLPDLFSSDQRLLACIDHIKKGAESRKEIDFDNSRVTIVG